jgi:hypothetical protein
MFCCGNLSGELYLVVETWMLVCWRAFGMQLLYDDWVLFSRIVGGLRRSV